MRVTARDQSWKVNHMSNAISNRKIITESTRFISSTRTVNQSLRWRVKPPKIKALAYGLIERTSSTLDEIASKSIHKGKEEKEVRH